MNNKQYIRPVAEILRLAEVRTDIIEVSGGDSFWTEEESQG